MQEGVGQATNTAGNKLSGAATKQQKQKAKQCSHKPIIDRRGRACGSAEGADLPTINLLPAT